MMTLTSHLLQIKIQKMVITAHTRPYHMAQHSFLHNLETNSIAKDYTTIASMHYAANSGDIEKLYHIILKKIRSCQ